MKLTIAALFVTFACFTNSWAHGGGTDSNGCHTDHKTGGYHCH
ncbi:YHYH domain-containing protein [Rhizobium sp. RHZ02]|nr:YHYH domain-containing protein [Rhizobium sp. RHZ02]MBD9451116.1 YHYH domain-containing protein [Rhizobium sp. RHZ02]NMN69457.1 hypothetical protein [Rhizobium sp. 57MFTsu3.2]